MHVYRNQFDPNLQLDYLGALAKVEARKAAEQTRKKLLEAASSLNGEYGEEGYVVMLGDRGNSQEDASQQSQEDETGQETPDSEANASELFSHYA